MEENSQLFERIELMKREVQFREVEISDINGRLNEEVENVRIEKMKVIEAEKKVRKC